MIVVLLLVSIVGGAVGAALVLSIVHRPDRPSLLTGAMSPPCSAERHAEGLRHANRVQAAVLCTWCGAWIKPDVNVLAGSE